MKRSPPQDKLVVKKIETSDKDIDDDRKYLVDWFYNFIFKNEWKLFKQGCQRRYVSRRTYGNSCRN